MWVPVLEEKAPAMSRCLGNESVELNGLSGMESKVFQPLYDRGDEEQQFAGQLRAEDWSAHLASQNANLEPLVEGQAISLPRLHVKVRREEYRQ
jgi:hypothetical protein